MLYGSLPVETLQAWALLNEVELPAAQVTPNIVDNEGNSKGGGLVATRDVSAGDVLLKIPAELIVSKQQVEQCIRADARLREVMEQLEAFMKVGELSAIR